MSDAFFVSFFFSGFSKFRSRLSHHTASAVHHISRGAQTRRPWITNLETRPLPFYRPTYLVSWVLKPHVAKLRTAFPFQKMNPSQQLLFCLVFNPMELSPEHLYRSCLGRGSQTAVNPGPKSAPSEEKGGKTFKCKSPTGHGMHTCHF